MTALRTHFACPRCAAHPQASAASPTLLFTDTVGGLTLHACGACGGIFLGTACAQRLAEALPHDAIRRANHTAASARYVASTLEPLACPMCGQTMRRTQVSRAGVDLDVCGAHGTWYDRDELRLVALAIGWSGAGAHAAAAPAPARYETSTAEVATDVAASVGVEVAAELAIEGVFGMLGALFD